MILLLIILLLVHICKNSNFNHIQLNLKNKKHVKHGTCIMRYHNRRTDEGGLRGVGVARHQMEEVQSGERELCTVSPSSKICGVLPALMFFTFLMEATNKLHHMLHHLSK